jgi:general secretion pathway protein J
MIRRLRPGTPSGVEGFTLVETLMALLLLGLVVSLLASVTAEWLPNWKRGLLRARLSEKVAIALDRLVTDLSAAQYVSVDRQNRVPLFYGDERSVAFVRSAVGPNGSRGLEIVRISENADDIGPALVRMRAPFKPYDLSVEQIPFVEPVVLLRAPLHVTFGFAGSDGKWQKTWHNAGRLPTAIRFVVRNDADRSALISTAARINVDMMAPSEISETPASTAAAASATSNPTGATQ